MDSLTQVVLGAAMGEAVCGKKIGNKALLLGAIAGTIPDLDVLASPFLDTLGELTFHRSITHSIFFAPIGGWLFMMLFWKLFNWTKITKLDLFWLFFWGFLTHALLDTCTTWGTQLLWPFSTYGFAIYNIFVVDPGYTIPFIGFLAAILFIKKENPLRTKLNWAGILLSTSYLITAYFFQLNAESIFKRNLTQQGIDIEAIITKTTPFNIILWTCSVKTTEGYYTGFYSLLDKDQEVKFQFEPHNNHLLASYIENKDIQKLLEVTKGFYTTEPAEKGVIINDLRFGKFNGWQGEEKGEYVFQYQIKPINQNPLEIEISQTPYRKPINKAYIFSFLHRISGKK